MMKSKRAYEDLERHFVAPNLLSPHYKDVKRLPRKLKKNIKNNYEYVWKSKSLDLGQKLWFRLNHVNPDYVRFIIKKICEINSPDNQQVT